MAEITLTDFVDILCLKNQLINVDEEVLLEVYKNLDNYETFLNSVILMSEIEGESVFLLYRDSFIRKIEKIVNIHRYDVTDKNIHDSINEIIGYLNHIKTYSLEDRRILKTAYRYYHESVRKTTFNDEKDFLYALAYDAAVYAAIVEDDMDKITVDNMFLSSINYLLETIPVIFDNEDVEERTLSRISEIEKGWNPFTKNIRKKCKVTKENYQKIKTKGE